jgi:uncharacterized membrane protein (UPF0182 family)
MKKARNLVLIALVMLIWAALAGGITIYIEGIWFKSLGYWQVFRLTLSSRFIAFTGGGLIGFGILWVGIWLSSRRAKTEGFWFRQEFVGVAQKSSRAMLTVIAAAGAVIGGLVAQHHWMAFLQFFNRVDGGTTDPIFSRDTGFYLFVLPVYQLCTDYLLGLLLLGLLLSAAGYLVHGHLGYLNGLRLSRLARNHLTLNLAALLLVVGLRYWIHRFDILYSSGRVVYGAGYTDINGWLPIYFILAAASVLTAIVLLSSLAARSIRPTLISVISYLLLTFVAQLFPPLLQTFWVSPNELQRETPFIRNHIESTLAAYKLDQIDIRDFQTGAPITEEDFSQHQGTLRNIRLWDWRPLKDAYGQLQSIRLYYEFEDVDVDRYSIDEQPRQVMLSVRELDFSRISESAQNWINKHFQYTHGQGLCMSPVNEVTAEGLPEFFIKDIPPRSSIDLHIDRPAIYFGEKADYPVFVRTNMEEFDYPIGETNATTTYRADRGLPVNSLLMRMLFAWELGTYQVLFTGNFNADSRVLLHRRIQDRVERLAPFLYFDEDPYVVIDEGKLFWIQDAYTVSDRYPYSEPFPSRASPRFNYIRNSVKIVIDAYLGDVFFYISDPTDPLIQTYSKVFPGMFRNLDEMSPGIHSHIRYPTDFFDVQRHIYRKYHMTDPTVFYNQEDVWEVPNEIYRGTEQAMESYYVIMSLPGSNDEEFILLIPFTPRNKNNMIAWLAARSDGADYGKLVLYQFPKQELTYGPMQIEARIDQNPDISQLITLWSQKGSQVIRGNLLVIPFAHSVLYVEPLYLQAEKSEIPELTRVIVVYENQVALGETLDQALSRAVFGAEGSLRPGIGSREPEPAESAPAGPDTGQISDLLRQAIQSFDASQQFLRQGDWASYGEEQRKLGDLLRRLKEQENPR